MQEFAFTENQKVSAMPRYCGIYFLFKNNSVVYVGQSENILTRINAHYNSDKVFDSWNYIEAHKVDLNNLEAESILKYNPPLNQVLPTNSIWISDNSLKLKYGIGKNEAKSLVKNGLVSPPVYFKTHKYYLIDDFISTGIIGAVYERS